jgi:hypothetical protein
VDDWLVYHTDDRNYLPYDFQTDLQSKAVSTWLNPRKDNYYLELTLPLGTCVYFNNHLWYKTSQVGTVHILLAEVFAQESSLKDPVFLTIYNDKRRIPIDKIGIVNTATPTLLAKTFSYIQGPVSEGQKPIKLPKLPLRNEAALWLLVIIVLYAIIRQFDPREFSQLLSMSDLTRNPLEGYGGASRKIWTSTNILMMVANCLAITYVFSLSDRYEQANQLVQSGLVSIGLVPINGVLPIVFFLMGGMYYVSKYMLIEFGGTVFQVSKLAAIHFFEFLRLSSFLSVSLLILVVLVYNTFFISLDVFWIGLVVLVGIMQLSRMVKVTLVAVGMTGFRLLYLIAYLCITEIVPTVILFRILMPTA